MNHRGASKRPQPRQVISRRLSSLGPKQPRLVKLGLEPSSKVSKLTLTTAKILLKEVRHWISKHFASRFGQRSLATKFTELESNRIAVWLISKKKLSLTSDTNLDSQGRFSESLKAKEANFGY
uniref:Transposase n=1 Tax=Heterorhabditis bacteriophora TaxID=37862 RepID=A0A1I7W9W4_HETBA